MATASSVRIELQCLRAACACFGVLSLLTEACSEAEAPQLTAAGHRVLVSQAGSTTVAAIDPSTGRMEQRIVVGELPHRLLSNRSGSTVYVVLVGSQAIAEIDTRSLTLRRTFLTAPVPEARSDGTPITAHATEDAFSHTSCFDCHHPEGKKPFVVGERPVGIALSEDESRLYVSHIRGARLSVIDLQDGSLQRSMVLPPSAAAVESADLARVNTELIVTLRPTQPSTEPGAVRFLDEDTLETLAEFPTGSDPAALCALPERESVLVSNFESDTVTELSRTRDPRVFTVSPGPLGAIVLRDRAQAWTLDYYSNAGSVLDLENGDVEPFPLQQGDRAYVNPTHATLSPDGRLAYVVSSGTDGHLLTVDVATHAVRAAIPIDGLSFDAVTVPR